MGAVRVLFLRATLPSRQPLWMGLRVPHSSGLNTSGLRILPVTRPVLQDKPLPYPALYLVVCRPDIEGPQVLYFKEGLSRIAST